MSARPTGNYAHLTDQAVGNLNRIVADTAHPTYGIMRYLKTMLDSVEVFSAEEQQIVSSALVTCQYDKLHEVMQAKERAVHLKRLLSYAWNVAKWIVTVICFVGLSLITGGHSIILGMPVWLGYGGTMLRWSLWGVLGSFVFGVGITCVLYRFVFRLAFAALWEVLKPLLGFVCESVKLFLKDAMDMVCWFFRTSLDWLKSLLSAHGFPSDGEECTLPICDMAKAITRFGGMLTVQKLGAVLVTVLVALNATHEFVDANGARLAIVPQDFPALPTVSEQQYRLVRHAPGVNAEGGQKDIPKSPFQQRAEFMAEQEMKKPKETCEDSTSSWNAFFYGWGVWGVKTAAEHASMYAVKTVARKAYAWLFDGNLVNAMPVFRGVVSVVAGAVSTQFVDHSSNTVVGLVVGAVTTIVWKGIGYLMALKLDSIFGPPAAGVAQNGRVHTHPNSGRNANGNPSATQG